MRLNQQLKPAHNVTKNALRVSVGAILKEVTNANNNQTWQMFAKCGRQLYATINYSYTIDTQRTLQHRIHRN